MKPVRTLRIFQIVGIVFTLLLFEIIYTLPANSGDATITPLKWGLVLFALLSAVFGFTLQRRIQRTPANPQLAVKSTPVKRWMVGNVIRIAYAISVSLYGILLHFLGGPERLAAALVALGLVLLLFWSPGEVPQESDRQTGQ
jgi:hypothetical protein